MTTPRRLTDVLRDRDSATRILDPSDHRFVTGSEKDRANGYNHFRDDDDIEALVIAETETPLDRAYRELIAAREGIQLQPGEKLINGDGAFFRDD